MDKFAKQRLEQTIRTCMEATVVEVDHIAGARFLSYVDRQASWDSVYANIEGRIRAIMKEIEDANI